MPASCCSTSRSPTSITSCARNCASNCRRCFAASGAIFVYATTEPSEALLLGGNTAALAEGRITQFGRTIDVYRRPNDLLTARTFADPPLNTMQVPKTGDRFEIGGKPVRRCRRIFRPAGWPCTIAFHPHHLALTSQHPASASLQRAHGDLGNRRLGKLHSHRVRGQPLGHRSPGIHDIEPDASSLSMSTRAT